MFHKILIANRGEIACRVAATARRMGIRTVAVYSDADASAKHVAACDESVHIGGSAPKDSYLRWERIIEAARRTGAQAIHPGYGFLSENEDFARACSAAGLVFIGPPASAIQAMGLKAESKQLMAQAGVPLVPGYHGADQDPALLQREAGQLTYPVLIKASAGGGGKGMRVVERAQDFMAALDSCKREAINSFGSDVVLIEKYVQRPRHIEIQVFCDTQAEIDHYWDGLSAGGDPNAQQCGWLKDKFGLSWQIVPRMLGEILKGPDAAASQRMMSALMEMKKLDIAQLQAAAKG